jgi:5,10-methylenetetrahydromethanopterin reductase
MVSADFGVAFEGNHPPDVVRPVIEAAEAGGAGTLWFASHLFQREPIAVAAMSLALTRRAGAALMAMSPYTVHPVYATMAAATLDEYFPGRVQLCFGMGAPRDLAAAGVEAPQPLRTLRETIEIARALLAGEQVNFAGRRYRVQGRRLATGPRRIPIVLAASGPQMLELAGAIADGVLISAATSPAFIRWSLDQVRRGEEAHGRRVRKSALVYASVDDDEKSAHDRLRRTLAFILRGAHHAPNLHLAGTMLDQQALADAFAAEDWRRIDALVTDSVVCRHAASGTAAQVAAGFAAYRGVGLDEIVVSGVASSEQLRRVLAAADPSSPPTP